MGKYIFGWFVAIPVILSALLVATVARPGLGSLALKNFEAVVTLF